MTMQSNTHSSTPATAAAAAKTKGFLPHQADDHEIWEPSRSRTPSSTMDFVEMSDYKPKGCDEEHFANEIIPKLEALKHVDQWSTKAMDGRTPRAKRKAHVLGHDRYLVHTVRYSAKSPEDCCSIVRKIQHLMLLENQAMNG